MSTKTAANAQAPVAPAKPLTPECGWINQMRAADGSPVANGNAYSVRITDPVLDAAIKAVYPNGLVAFGLKGKPGMILKGSTRAPRVG